jgi:hypothetical protein
LDLTKVKREPLEECCYLSGRLPITLNACLTHLFSELVKVKRSDAYGDYTERALGGYMSNISHLDIR